jgi:hypothetical protein
MVLGHCVVRRDLDDRVGMLHTHSFPCDHGRVSDEVQVAVDRAFIERVDGCVDRMHDSSQNIVGSSAGAAAICRDVLRSFWARRTALVDDDLTNDALLMATRERSLEHLRANGWDSLGEGNQGATGFHDSPAIRYRVELAHAGAVVQGAANASLVDLHGRHGVAEAVLGDALGVTGAAVGLRLAHLRKEFGDAVAAFTIWNGGRPSCAVLTEALGRDAFDHDVLDTTDRHRRSCAECAREYRSIVNPAGLFLTAPVARVAPAVRRIMLSFADDALVVDGTRRSASTTAAAAALTAGDAIGDSRRPDEDDEIAELWASAAPPVRTSTAPMAVPARRRSQPTAAVVVAGGLASLAVVAGGVALVAGATGGNDRIVIDTPVDTGPAVQTEAEPEVRSLGPVPPTFESTVAPSTSATADSTSTSTPASTSTTVPVTVPGRSTATTTSSSPRVASGVPPVPTATTTSLAPTVPVTTTASTTTSTTTTATTEPPTTTATTATTEPPTTTATTATTVPDTTPSDTSSP